MFARGAATEVVSCDEDLRTTVSTVEREIGTRLALFVVAPVVEEVVAESLSFDGLEESDRKSVV